MYSLSKPKNYPLAIIGLALPLLVVALLVFYLPGAPAQAMDAGASAASGQLVVAQAPEVQTLAPTAPCAGGPTIDGIVLDECVTEDFNVGGGTGERITVWYTKNPVTATRMVDGNPVVLSHWINTDAQAQQVGDWAREAWEKYFLVFGRDPYNNGCTSGGRKNINIQMEDGVGWAGIAYWASSGTCNIGIDFPMVRGGGGQWVVYHEVAHYQQYSFDAGCYSHFKPNYPDNAEFVEGYADLGADAVDAALDATGYSNAVQGYNPDKSMFDHGYGNVFNKYYIEQVGNQYNPTDPHHHMDANLEHYLECDVQDNFYVLDTVIPAETGGALTEELLFLNFYAANWAKDWADPTTQPELVYTDDDGNAYGQIDLTQNVVLSSGSQSWTGESTPDDWAGKYYQVQPQGSCQYVEVQVDGVSGAHLGINLMAASTSGSISVSRAGWIGEDFTRTFPGAGVHDRITAAVNAFANNHTYDVSFTCAIPSLNLLEPKPNPNFTLVGAPDSPIAFLARFEVTDSTGNPVLGLPESSFTANAEGDAVTFVPGSFQEVSEEYWAVMLPPTKPLGTTFIDLQVCLDGGVCDTNTDALLYVDPGNTDFGLAFDGSGSMGDIDVPGEGSRLENAQKAGTVLADLLRDGDRVLITSFSAFDNPTGCGLPGGSGDCPLDIITHLPRTDVVVPGTINQAEIAINNITDREWTPIGAALTDAKDKLLAAPFSLNPKRIVLLSDGEENVNPLYAAVRDEIISSGVVVDTVAFGADADEALMAQIAADTGGNYRFVPTTAGTRGPLNAASFDYLLSMGASAEFINEITAEYLPGPLALDDTYDWFETQGQGATRGLHLNSLAVPDGEWRTGSIYVDESVNSLRIVVAGKQPDQDGPPGTCYPGDNRKVEIRLPNDVQGRWIPVSPADIPAPPTNWDIRNSTYDDVVIVTNPISGTWEVRSRYFYQICRAPEVDDERAPTIGPYDFMTNASVQSDIRLQGRLLGDLVDNQGMAGDRVRIVATPLDRTGAIPGAVFFGTSGVIFGTLEKPGGSDLLSLWDDGMHGDGAANDGVYATDYTATNVGGSYNVWLFAFIEDPNAPGNFLRLDWYGTFWIDGPDADDEDGNGLPDEWERRCKLDALGDLPTDDPDQDGLTNLEELNLGTIPCDADTDNGGERDGSEVNGAAQPVEPPR